MSTENNIREVKLVRGKIKLIHKKSGRRSRYDSMLIGDSAVVADTKEAKSSVRSAAYHMQKSRGWKFNKGYTEDGKYAVTRIA